MCNQSVTQPTVSATSCQQGSIELNPLAGDVAGQDFQAILIGDCDLSWPSSSPPTPTPTPIEWPTPTPTGTVPPWAYPPHPNADASPNPARSGETVVLTLAEGQVLYWPWLVSWDQVAGLPVNLRNGDAQQASFIAPTTNAETTLTFRLRVLTHFGFPYCGEDVSHTLIDITILPPVPTGS
jgi:hypothetical protein